MTTPAHSLHLCESMGLPAKGKALSWEEELQHLTQYHCIPKTEKSFSVGKVLRRSLSHR